MQLTVVVNFNLINKPSLPKDDLKDSFLPILLSFFAIYQIIVLLKEWC